MTQGIPRVTHVGTATPMLCRGSFGRIIANLGIIADLVIVCIFEIIICILLHSPINYGQFRDSWAAALKQSCENLKIEFLEFPSLLKSNGGNSQNQKISVFNPFQ